MASSLTLGSFSACLILAVWGCAPQPLRFTPRPNAIRADAVRLAREADAALRVGKLRVAARKADEAVAIAPGLALAHEVRLLLAELRDDQSGHFAALVGALSRGDSRAAIHLLPSLNLAHLSAKQREQLERLLSRIEALHVDPAVRASVRRPLATLREAAGDMEGARSAGQAQGVITSWWGIGGFDNENGRGFDTPYAPESEFVFDRDYAVTRGKASWVRVQPQRRRYSLSLRDHFRPINWNAVYLTTYLTTKKAGVFVLKVETSTPVKAWIDGRLVLAERKVRGGGRRPLAAKVRIGAKGGRLLIKMAHGTGPWKLSAYFSDLAGDPAPVTATLQTMPRGGSQGVHPEPSAVQQVPSAIRAMSSGPRRLYWSVVALAQAGLLRRALGRMKRYLVTHGADPAALLLSQRLHRQAGERQRAARLVNRGMLLPAPYNLRFAVERARIYRRRGQLHKAQETLEGAAPRSEIVRAGAVHWQHEQHRLLVRRGWVEERCRLARRVAGWRPEWSRAHDWLASCARTLGRPGATIAHLQRALSLMPGHLGLRQRLTGAHADQGDCGSAIDLAKGTVSRFPDRPASHARLADLYRRCQRFSAAELAYKKALRLAPGWGRPHARLGDLQLERGDAKSAVESWRQALLRDPDNADLWDRVSRLAPSRHALLKRWSPAPAEIRRAIAAARRVRVKPGSSIIWLMDDDVSRLMDDGTVKRLVTLVRMAVDRRGRDRLGSAKLPRGGLVKVLDAYAIDRRGRRREVTSMHGRKVRYPTLEEGTVVVLQYLHVRHPQGYLRKHFTASWFFQQALGQLEHGRWVLALPRSRKFHLRVKGNISHTKREQGALTVHQFSVKAMPPLRPEPRSLPVRDLLASVTVSTVPSWDYFSSWGRSLTSDVFEMDPVLQATLEGLIKGAKTVEERVRRIYHFALTQIRYQQDYETFIAGVKPHPAAAVLARRYGDCKDKSVLIIAMLKQLGIKAHFALVRTRRKGEVVPEVPSQQFNHAIVYLPKQRGIAQSRFMDATAELLDVDTLRADDQGTLALVLFADGHKLVPIPYQAPEHNVDKMEVSLMVDADGRGAGRLIWVMRGHRAGVLRKPLANDQLLRQYGQSVLHRISVGARLKRVTALNRRNVLKPLILHLEAAFPTFARRVGDGLRIKLPKVFSHGAMARWGERRHPLFLGPPGIREAGLVLKLPAGYQLESLPPSLETRGKCLRIRSQWKALPGTATVKYEQVLRHSCAVVPSRDYHAFRELLNKLERAQEQELVLKKVATGKPRRPRGRRRSK